MECLRRMPGDAFAILRNEEKLIAAVSLHLSGEARGLSVAANEGRERMERLPEGLPDCGGALVSGYAGIDLFQQSRDTLAQHMAVVHDDVTVVASESDVPRRLCPSLPTGPPWWAEALRPHDQLVFTHRAREFLGKRLQELGLAGDFGTVEVPRIHTFGDRAIPPSFFGVEEHAAVEPTAVSRERPAQPIYARRDGFHCRVRAPTDMLHKLIRPMVLPSSHRAWAVCPRPIPVVRPQERTARSSLRFSSQIGRAASPKISFLPLALRTMVTCGVLGVVAWRTGKSEILTSGSEASHSFSTCQRPTVSVPSKAASRSTPSYF